jgi:hypothetical protein
MTEDHQFRSGQTLTFASGKPRFRTIVLAGFIALLAIVAFTTGNLRTVAPPGNAAGLVVVFIFASILFLTITRQWTAEIDLDTQRLRIFRRSFGRWKREIVDCSLDECCAFGTIEYNNDGHVSCGVYVQLTGPTSPGTPRSARG